MKGLLYTLTRTIAKTCKESAYNFQTTMYISRLPLLIEHPDALPPLINNSSSQILQRLLFERFPSDGNPAGLENKAADYIGDGIP